MAEAKKPQLPIGYWLKKADEVLTARIDETQQANGLSRTDWQILNVLHEVGSATRERLGAPMHPFADAAALSDAILRLAKRGLIEGDGSAASQYKLTGLGREMHEVAFSLQKEVRRRSVKGISEADYTTAVRVLRELVENLNGSDAAQQGAPAEPVPTQGIKIKQYKPQGYSSVSTYIVANGAQTLIDFLSEAFGAKQTRRYDNPGGTIMHAEVQIDDTVVMIADGGGDHPAFPVWLHVYVPDVDASYRCALEAGGRAVAAPERKNEDPDRRAEVKDPAGNTWFIATQLGEESRG